jgi:hypothetical protein
MGKLFKLYYFMGSPYLSSLGWHKQNPWKTNQQLLIVCDKSLTRKLENIKK